MIQERHGGGGRRTRSTHVTETTTMLIGLVLGSLGLGFLCWLLFTLAVYAFPFFAGMTAGLAAFQSGAGIIGAFIVGILASGATLALGQIAFATSRMPVTRAAIGLLYALPAAIAGYRVSFALAGIGMSTGGWHQAFAVFGAVLAGITALSRLALSVPPADVQGSRGASSLAY
jgi:hypothetical protein